MIFRVALLLFFCGSVHAQKPYTEVEGGFTRDTLSGGRADWRSHYLDAAHTFRARQTLYGGLRRTERFGLRDSEAMIGYSHPLSETLTGLVEASHSPQHNVLARNSYYGQLAWLVSPGWVLTGGVRRSEYTRSDTSLLLAGVERYWGNFRAGYTLYNGRPEGAGSGSAHRFALDYYYGERSRIGIGLTTGREIENVGPPTGITSTDVAALGIGGRHWLTQSWALSWDLATQRQGSLYRRDGLRLGLRYRF